MKILAALVIIGIILVLGATGYLSSSPNGTVEKYIEATRNGNCEIVIDLATPETADSYIQGCQKYSGKIINIKILNEETRGIPFLWEAARVTAQVDVQGVSSNTGDYYLVRGRGSGWKLTEVR